MNTFYKVIEKAISVLLIEDDDLYAKIVKHKLSESYENHFQLQRASTLEQGLELVRKINPDILLLDLTLPDSSGIETLTNVLSVAPNVSVVVFTGLDNSQLALEALHLGAQDYISKGTETYDLPRIIRYAIERHAVLQHLQQARKEATLALEAQTTFLSNMSHEIRTPLTSIIGFSETVHGPGLSAAQQHAIGTIKRNAEHLLQVINDILDFSKIEANQVQIEKIDFNLFDILDQVETSFKVAAQERGIDFSIECDPPLPEIINSDPTRLKQVLFNLISNGIKFTKNGYVKVVLSLTKEKFLEFKVVDTGMGLTPEEQKKLFKAFSQADASTTREFGGTGLGLIISKQLAERLGGGINIQSVKNRGSIFSFTVDIGEVDETKFSWTPQLSSSRQVTETADAEAPALQGTVLVVDDMPDNRDLMNRLISETGLEVELATGGHMAIECAASKQFSLILLDMQMPKCDGYQAVRQMRASGYSGPVVAVTASVFNKAAQRCIQAGCNDYLSKPFKRNELYAVLTKYINDVQAGEAQLKPSTAPAKTLAGSKIADIIEKFVERLPARLEALTNAHSNRDYQELGFLAHRLIGAELFGLPKLGELARELKNASCANNAFAVQETLNKIFAFYQQLQSANQATRSAVAGLAGLGKANAGSTTKDSGK